MKNAMEAMQEATKRELQEELAKKPGKEEVQAMIDERMRTVVGSGQDGSGGDIKEKRKVEMIIGGFPRDTRGRRSSTRSRGLWRTRV